MKYFKLIFRNLRRNPLRSSLTALVTIVLVFVVTMAWSVLWLLDLVTAEKSQNFQAMVADRWAVPSRLPYAYSEPISRGAATKSRRRAPAGLDDVAVLHRHARSGEAQPREHGFRHRLRARQDRHDDGGPRRPAARTSESNCWPTSTSSRRPRKGSFSATTTSAPRTSGSASG